MTEQRLLIKDDSELFYIIRRGPELRRQKGIAEPTETFDVKEASKTWHEMRQARVIFNRKIEL